MRLILNNEVPLAPLPGCQKFYFQIAMDLSLVIPSYNRADLIGETIQSALDQTHGFAEIIVVDDASTDDTLARLKQFGTRITVIASSKVGVQEARNIGVSAARTPYVTLCDSDDILQPTYVEIIGSWLDKQQDCDAVYTNHQVFQGDVTGVPTFSRAPDGFFSSAVQDGSFRTSVPDLYRKTLAFQPLLASGVTLKTSFYNAIGGFDKSFNGVPSEDWEFTLRVLHGGNVALCDDPLTLIRRHNGNESKNNLRQRLGEIVVMEHAIAHHNCSVHYHPAFVETINRHRLWAFEEAFGTKKLRLAAAIFPLLVDRPRSLKFFVKAMLIRSYMVLTNYRAPPLHTQFAEASR
jgi:glycosyltransferase involved in cell wall biosynthesis